MTSSSDREGSLRGLGWVWAGVGGLMVFAALGEGPRNVTAEKWVVLGLGALDMVAGALVLRRVAVGRLLLVAALTAHAILAVWLWRDAQRLSASLALAATQPMTHQQMTERTAGGAMLGMIVLFEQTLAAVSALLSIWAAVAFFRSRWRVRRDRRSS